MNKRLSIVLAIFFLLTVNNLNAQKSKSVILNQGVQNESGIVSVSAGNEQKVASGLLIRNISEKQITYQKMSADKIQDDLKVPKEFVAVYMDAFPTANQISSFEAQGIICHTEIWIPPLINHPYGFFLAEMPIDKLDEILNFYFVKKLNTVENQNYPMNSSGTAAINADDVWSEGYTGSGVKVAVLDSGLDTDYAGTEFPTTFDKKDYSAYPTLDDDVENTVSGHGTHVAGSVLGSGFYSTGRSDDGNGTAKFCGSAPDADLVFLKIGSDATSGASSAAMIAAMQAAVNTYNADILSMSYGGWYDHHDGSSTTEQTVDWVYDQGVPFFISAGNSANYSFHYSGTVPASGETGFIELSATASANLVYNLVWYDGLAIDNDLYLQYYDSGYNFIATTQYSTTESDRGTHSKYSEHGSAVTAGTYHVKVFNNSPNSQFFHIYFYDTGPNITFVSPDPYYTIGQPASADHAFAVGAYVTRDIWYRSSDGGGMWYGYGSTDIITSFSSRGPRVNGGVTKPNITAPGSAIISVRDTDVLTSTSNSWIDNDGTTGAGAANYYVMQGTSMACPITAGAACLLLEKELTATAQNVYDAIEETAASNVNTGALPNDTWGNGILDVYAASNSSSLPVELTEFFALLEGGSINLFWKTETEVNNYGFDVQKREYGSQNTEWNKIGFVEGFGTSNSPKEYSFLDYLTPDNNLPEVDYRLKQIDNDGAFAYSKIVSVDLSTITDIREEKDFVFALEQNYPNPFNPVTSIKYQLAEEENVKLKVYDILGKEVIVLVNTVQNPGKYDVEFNASNLSAGVYIYRLMAGEFISAKKFVLMK